MSKEESFWASMLKTIKREKEYSEWMKEKNPSFKGVLGGFSKAFGFEPFFVKFSYFILTLFFFNFFGIALYFALHWFMIKDYKKESDLKDSSNLRKKSTIKFESKKEVFVEKI